MITRPTFSGFHQPPAGLLYLPRVGPYASNDPTLISSVFSETLSGTYSFLTRSFPYRVNAATVEAMLVEGFEPNYPSLYLWANTVYMPFDGYIDAQGVPGGDAAELQGGLGGNGFNGGGGGGGASGDGFSLGGGGGFSGGSGDPGQTDDPDMAGVIGGDGGAGAGYTDSYAYTVHPGPGGDGGLAAEPGEMLYSTGGGGGASGGRIVIVANEWITSPAAAGFFANGGIAGIGMNGGNDGTPGGLGTVHLYFRKYPGDIIISSGAEWELWEIDGPEGSETLTQHFSLTDTWNNF